MKKQLNIFKYISRALMGLFIVLSTVQVLLDMKMAFGFIIPLQVYIATFAASFLPILLLTIIMNFVNKKTKNVTLFVIKEIRSVIRMLFYVAVFAVFILWNICIISIIGFYFTSEIAFDIFSVFLLKRLAFSIVYSTVVVLFFSGLSAVDFKRENKNEVQ